MFRMFICILLIALGCGACQEAQRHPPAQEAVLDSAASGVLIPEDTSQYHMPVQPADSGQKLNMPVEQGDASVQPK